MCGGANPGQVADNKNRSVLSRENNHLILMVNKTKQMIVYFDRNRNFSNNIYPSWENNEACGKE